MQDVDLRAVWSGGHAIFGYWFVGVGTISKYFLIRRVTKLSRAQAIGANIAVAAASWLVVVRIPLAAFAWAIVDELLLKNAYRGSVGPATWISVLVLSAMAAALAEFFVLSLISRQRMARIAFLSFAAVNLACIGIAVYRMINYLLDHPPEA